MSVGDETESEKTLDQVLSELPTRALYLGGETGLKPVTYRPVEIDDPAITGQQFVLIEIDRDEDGSPAAVSWWPGGTVSKEMQRGPQMPVALMLLEARLLMAINSIERVLVTMDKTIRWNPEWTGTAG